MKFAMSLLMLAFMTVTAPAAQLFNTDNGRWTVTGYVDEYTDDRYCMVSTYWDDGRKININVFPNTNYITMTFHNPYFKAYANRETIFASFRYSDGRVDNYKGWPKVKSKNVTIFRNVPENFLQDFADAKELVFFYGQPNEVTVYLDGTQDIINDMLPECINVVRGYE